MKSTRDKRRGTRGQSFDPSAVELMPMVKRLQIARQLARKGKSKKLIRKKTQLDDDEIQAIIDAETGIAERLSHRDTLKKMLVKLQGLLPTAYATYESNPSGYNAGAINTLSAEVRSIMAHIDDLQRPESQVLELIQTILQPFIRDSMRDHVVELRTARQACIAVAETPEAERAIRAAFGSLAKNMGISFQDRYSEYTEKLGLLMQCDLEELRKVARDSMSESVDQQAALGDSNVVSLPGRR